jgi:hypothetical protein
MNRRRLIGVWIRERRSVMKSFSLLVFLLTSFSQRRLYLVNIGARGAGLGRPTGH